MRAAEELGRFALRVPADELDTPVRVRARRSEAAPLETSRPVTSSVASGSDATNARERPQRELEPVLLRLVAGEQEDRTVARAAPPPA